MNHLLKILKPLKARLEPLYDSVVFTDLKGDISYLNPAAEKLFRQKPVKANELFCDTGTFQKLLVELSIYKCKTETALLKLSRPKAFTITGMLIHDPAGNPAGIQLNIHNPETRKINHPFTPEKNSLLAAMNFRTKEFIIVADHINQQILYCSQCVRDILGWESSDFMNGGWPFELALVYPDDLEELADYHAKEFKKRNEKPFIFDNVPIIYESRLKSKNGTYVWIRTELFVMERNDEGAIQYSMNFLQDITHEKINADGNNKFSVDMIYDNAMDFLLSDDHKRNSTDSVLSKREKEILAMISGGFSSKEIAGRLGLATTSVNACRKILMNKLNAKNAADLIRISYEMKII